MAKLHEMVRYADELLNVAGIRDYPDAMNGLQVENSGEVRFVVAAVDACEAVVKAAAEKPGGLLVVHHGLFWGPKQAVTGAWRRKLGAAFAGDLAVYSAHLPLDAHAEIGNNVLLCAALGFRKTQACFEMQGTPVGRAVSARVGREDLREKLEAAVGGVVHCAPGGPEVCRKIAVVSGGAGGDVAKAAAEGFDTLITGEGPHWSYTAAEELGVNVFYAGHYATETFGVKALAAKLAKKFRVPWSFLDHPTGL